MVRFERAKNSRGKLIRKITVRYFIEAMDGVICISLIKELVTSEKPVKATADETRVKFEGNLRAKYSALSVEYVNISDREKRGGTEDLILFKVLNVCANIYL